MNVQLEMMSMLQKRLSDPAQWDEEAGARMLWLQKCQDFISCAGKGDVDKLAKFLDEGVPLDVLDIDEGQALLTAAYHGQAACVEFLLAKGADPMGRRKDGMTPLMAAAWSGSAECVQKLLAVGSPMDCGGRQGFNALMYAVCKDSVESIRILAKACGVAARDARGYDALMLSAEQGGSLAGLMALAESFEACSLSNGGEKASEIAKRRGNDEYAEFLQGWELSKREAAAIENEARQGAQKSKVKAL